MRNATNDEPGRVLYAVALCFAAALGVGVATRQVIWLAGVVPDDAFYYLQIARNIARTGFSSFDGVHATNGYHPAWMGALALCALIFRDPDTLLRVCLLTAFSFHLLSSWALLGAFKHWMSAPAARLGATLWLLNPLPISLAVQGMEASIYVCALAFALRLYAARIHPALSQGESPRYGDLALFGGGLSLCFYGRTEAVIIAAFAMAAIGLALLQRPSALLRMFTLGGSFATGIAPWFVYTYLSTGSLVQGSGAMKMLWAREAGSAGTLHKVIVATHYVFGQWLSFPLEDVVAGNAAPGALRGAIAFAGCVMLVCALRRAATHAETRAYALVAGCLLLATFVSGSVYGFLFADSQYWYKAQPGFVLFVVSYGSLVATLSRRSTLPAALNQLTWAASTLLALVSLARVATLSSYPWQRDVLVSQRRFDALVPAGQNIGCFNAGIPGFFSDHTIVNLDGLVNNSVLPYYQQHRLDAYIRDAKITFIADEAWSLERGLKFAEHRLQLRELDRQALTGSAIPERLLWQVLPNE